VKTKKLPWLSAEEMERHGFTLDEDIDSSPRFDDDKVSDFGRNGMDPELRAIVEDALK
jgi:hypothetical protein